MNKQDATYNVHRRVIDAIPMLIARVKCFLLRRIFFSCCMNVGNGRDELKCSLRAFGCGNLMRNLCEVRQTH